MITVEISPFIQAQGSLVRLEGDFAFINADGRLVYGRLLTPRAQLSKAAAASSHKA